MEWERNIGADGLTSRNLWQNAHIQLSEHPTARNKALARRDLPPGQTMLSDVALAAVLLPGQKGLRCDACFRRSLAMKRCSGCIEYWYCGTDCQTRHWKLIHRHMCRNIAKFRTTTDFQTSPTHRQMDAFLLSHLVAEHAHRLAESEELPPREDPNDSLAIFASLLPLSSTSQDDTPLICPLTRSSNVSPTVLKALFSRFSNNNFVVHSHLTPVGHGIFPLASRLFNHSCIPNAIVTYSFRQERVQVVVRALTKIKQGEEITIPYFDPALPFSRRQEISRYSYGFECTCSACLFSRSLDKIPKPPADPTERSKIEGLLLKHAFPELELHWSSQPLLFGLPAELNTILHEHFLPTLSETFSNSAHDGPHDLALQAGLVLLALYAVIYPSQFPQAGVHCLEVAKTAWNASVNVPSTGGIDEAGLLRTSRRFLSLAMDALSVLGKEGDLEDGPLMECMALDELLRSVEGNEL